MKVFILRRLETRLGTCRREAADGSPRRPDTDGEAGRRLPSHQLQADDLVWAVRDFERPRRRLNRRARLFQKITKTSRLER